MKKRYKFPPLDIQDTNPVVLEYLVEENEEGKIWAPLTDEIYRKLIKKQQEEK